MLGPSTDVAYPGDVDGSARVEPPGSTDGAPPEEKREEASVKPRDRLASIPILDVMLDSPTPGLAARTDSDPHGAPSPGRKAAYGLAAGLAVMAAIFGGLIVSEPGRAQVVSLAFLKAFQPTPRAVSAPAANATGPATPLTAPSATAMVQGSASTLPVVAGPPVPLIPSAPIPGPWRVGQLAGAPEIRLVEGTMDRRPLVEALRDAGLAPNQIYRLLGVLSPIRKFDRPHRRDSFVVAMDPASHRCALSSTR
jgi:hypothetical protein